MRAVKTWEPYNILGTTWYITLPQDCPNADIAVGTAWRWLDAFDAYYSRFRQDSYIGQLNATGTLTQPPPELRKLLDIGVRLYRESDGQLNFLTGHLQAARGYNQNLDLQESVIDTPSLPDPTTDLEYSTDSARLRAGAIDLGSFGKGYAIDQLTALLQDQTNSDFVLVNGGGDLRLHNPKKYSYPLYLQHPFNPDQFTHRIDHYHGSVANSNASLRRWTTKNTQKTYSHLLDLAHLNRDPDTLAAATVCAPTAVEADAKATLLTLLPQQPTQTRLLTHPYLRVFADGNSRHTTDFPGETLT